jgi:uncharacterized protein
MNISHDLDLPALGRWADAQRPNALFWTISGAHLYGFPSVDSDIDIRGSFLTPYRDLLGLTRTQDTHEKTDTIAGREVDFVAYEAAKLLQLLVKGNGNALEMVFSPLVVGGEEFLRELRPIAAKAACRASVHHYRGFYQSQRKQFEKDEPKKVKTLLYAYRTVLTGIHLMRTGEVIPHLPTLCKIYGFSGFGKVIGLSTVSELIEKKQAAEFGSLTNIDWEYHRGVLDRLEVELEAAHAESRLPESGPFEELDRFLVEQRLDQKP